MATAVRSKLEERVVKAAEAALADRHFVTAIDVLTGIGWLPTSQVDRWRQGRVDYLERQVTANLSKISIAMAAFRHWAWNQGLNPSETAYQLSPATLDDHEGDTLHEHEFVNVLSP